MKEEIVYRWATPRDHEAIIEFLRQHFYPVEPLTNSYEPKKQDIHDEEACREILQKGICPLAVCDGEIIGAFLGAPKGPDQEQILLEEASRIPGTKFGKMLLLLAAIEREANVFERFQVDRAFQGQVIAVNPKFIGGGVGYRLIGDMIKEARRMGYPLYTADCTSTHSLKIAMKLGLRIVSEYWYGDFRIPGSDEQIFFPPEDQSVVTILAMRL